METHIEKTVPIVKNFQIEERDWPTATQLKPQIPPSGSTTSFGDPEMEAIFSRFSHQNQDPQQFLSCTITSSQQGYSTCIPSSSSSNHHHHNHFNHHHNHLWDTNQGPTINLESNNDHIEIQKRGLEDYIPHHWNNQGRRTKVAYYTPPPPPLAAQNDFPYLSSWEASRSAHWRGGGGGGGGEEHLSSNLSFADLLANNGVGNTGFVPGWSSNYPVNNTSFDGSSLCFNQILGGEMQNCGSLHQYQSMCNANSSLKNMNAKYSNFGTYNQVPTEQNEQEVAAAMINLENDVNAVPNTDLGDKISMAVENHDPENGGDQVIDLNKTPAKKTRRRRYQPKVLSEKKPRKAPKPKTPKPTMETEQVKKKKYVRKSKVEVNATPATPPREANEGVEMKEKEGNEVGDTKTPESVAKSCKRSLNFDFNGQAGESSFTRVSNGDACGDTIRNEHNESGDQKKGVELVVEALSRGIAYDLNCALNQELENSRSLPPKDYIDNSQPDPNTLSSKIKEKIPRNNEILSGTEAPLPSQQSPNSSPCASSSERKNRRGSKRSNADVKEMDAGTVGPTFWPPNHAFTGNANIREHNFLLPETCKKKRTEKAQRPNVPSQSSSVQPQDLNQEVGAQNQPRVDPSSSKYYCCNTAPFGIEALTSNNQCNVTMESVEIIKSQFTGSWADLARLKKKRTRTTRVSDLAKLAGITSVLPAKRGPKGPRKKKIDVSENGHTEGSVPGSTVNPRSKISKKQSSENNELRLVLYRGDRSANNPTGCIRPLPWARTTTSIEEITTWMKKLDINKGSYKMKVRRTPKKGPQRNALQEQKALVPYLGNKQEQNNALVVYGRDGTMVPFDGPFDPVKKRRQRAKVDLDDETTKVWKLLLENIDNKGIDGTDEDKAQWWESERSVFRGRVDSFIARMRLVQGDRRFTPWKGSVLDSVIGVFLTQNVSDHLSSSAFMSLAAHFPLKSESTKSTLSEESATGLVGEPEIFITEPEESISWNDQTINQHILSSTTKIVHEIYQSDEKEVVKIRELTERTDNSGSPKDSSSESSQKTPSSIVSNINSQTTGSIFGDDRAKDDASSSQHSVISSQNSTNSPNLVNVGMLNVFSESESRTQPITTTSQFNYMDCSTSFLGLLKMAESPFLHETYHQTQDSLECMNSETRSFHEGQGTGSSNYMFNLNYQFPKGFEMLEVDSNAPNTSRKEENSSPTEQSNLTTENMSCYVLEGENMVMHSQSVKDQSNTNASSPNGQTSSTSKSTILSQVNGDVTESTTELKSTTVQTYGSSGMNGNASKSNRGKNGRAKNDTFDWDSLRKEAQPNGIKKERTANTMDSLDWEAVRHAHVSEIAEVIKERGMNNMLAERIKDLLDRLAREHGSIDMEWLRDIPPDKAKEYLLSFRGLGLKSVECVRLLTLHHLAFPVDTNVGRIAVRLGWVPLQPLPESLQLHLLELYPVLESIQKYLWPRLCKLDQKTLYELHYHLITFGKVFCTKRQPNCNACPLRGECRHFASAFASARFALPGPEERSIMPSNASSSANTSSQASSNPLPLPLPLPLPPALGNEHPQNSKCVNGVGIIEASPSSQLALPMPQTINHSERQSETKNCEPIVEVPASPEPEVQQTICCDIEDTFYEDPDEIPTIELNMKEFSQTLQNYIHTGESNALVALTPEAASIPTPKLKNISRLRTEHHVYELPDTHPLLKDLDKREPDDPCSYLLAIWTPGETADSIQPPERRCNPEDPNSMCTEETCSYCSSLREANSQTVRGTLLIPCRTAMRGSFPLNGTYFQVNEVFADHDSSLNPIAVPRSWLWNLPRRTVYFGTSIPTIFRGLNTEDIQHCFWRGFVCVRGFDKKSRAPRPLMARLHFPASRMQRGAKNRGYDE